MRAFHGFLRIGHQIHDLAAVGDVFGEPLLDGRGHWSAPAQGEDAVEILQHVKHNVAFQLTELPVRRTFEIFGNLHSRVMFDLVVGVGERQLHHLRRFLADAGLARAHHADDDGDGSTHSSHRIGQRMCSGQDASIGFGVALGFGHAVAAELLQHVLSDGDAPRPPRPPRERRCCRNAG